MPPPASPPPGSPVRGSPAKRLAAITFGQSPRRKARRLDGKLENMAWAAELEDSNVIAMLMQGYIVEGWSRKPKDCKLCADGCTSIDPVDETKWMVWGYAVDTKLLHEMFKVLVSGSVCWYCDKAHGIEFGNYKVKELAAAMENDENLKQRFHNTRDSVIAAVMAEGYTRLGKQVVNKYREMVFHDQVATTELSKTGVSYEKKRFEELFKDRPDILKKATFKPVRVRILHLFKYVFN